ncbi:MAG: hypothetical protein V2J11_07015 [Desulfofustis sp.]|jgi:hypothetical protein|nr:hypothetical protein [Desulfofustis sp.]
MTTPLRQRKRPTGLPICLLLALLVGLACPSRAETIRIPLSIDLPLLRTMIVNQAYPDPGEQTTIVSMAQRCNEITLSRPQVGSNGERLLFQTAITVHWGTPIAGACLAPLFWEGSLVLSQQPVIDRNWQLRFRTIDSTLLDRTGQPAPLAGLLWNLVKEHVHSYLGTITLNLAPPVDNLKQFMLSQASDNQNERTTSVLAGMHPDQPVVTPAALRIDMVAEAVPIDHGDGADEPEETMVTDAAAQAKVIDLWQSWDAMLIHLIGQLADKPLSAEDRQLLLDVMLSVRYEFDAALSGNQLTDSFVRDQFVRSWQVLRPLFRRHLDTDTSASLLGYLSFFTAADALTTLDRLGPLLGVDISRAGFYRLAHMIDEGPLDESDAVNPTLRRILGLDEPLAVPSDRPTGAEESRKDPGQNHEPAAEPPSAPNSSLNRWLQAAGRLATLLVTGPRPAHADTLPGIAELRSWTAGITPADKLLPRVHRVLEQIAADQWRRPVVKQLDGNWFTRMILATAWQESCFRQFVVKDDKIVYLISYNNTSIGLMQINEKIWRGIYDAQQLRWNIKYNGMAGAEILALYLERYISKRPARMSLKDEAGRRYLAAWLYALYNGGPSQLEKFPARHRAGDFFRSDKLFVEKYDRINGPDWSASVDCLPAR